jgi:hypothetical protein
MFLESSEFLDLQVLLELVLISGGKDCIKKFYDQFKKLLKIEEVGRRGRQNTRSKSDGYIAEEGERLQQRWLSVVVTVAAEQKNR